MNQSKVAIDVTIAFVLSAIAMLIGVNLAPQVASAVSEIGVAQLEAQLTWIFILIVFIGIIAFFGMIGKLVDSNSESYNEPDRKEGLLEEPKPEPKTVNCSNCGGPNVDRITCEWCGQVL